MKKLFLLPMFTLLFSCSQQDNSTNENPTINKENTEDTLNNYNSMYYQFQLIPYGINYKFINLTELTLKFKGNFGLAYHDGNNNGHYYTPTGEFNTSLIPDFSTLCATNDYGGYIEADEITMPPNYSFHIPPHTDHVPVSPTPITYNNPLGSYFEFQNNGASYNEIELIREYGKLYFVKFDIYDISLKKIDKSIIKIAFPENVNSKNQSPQIWKPIYNDSFFNEELIYNVESREICLTTNQFSTFTSSYTFEYGDETYKVHSEIDSYNVIIYLTKL